MKQSEVFLKGEAEQWFARNQNKLPLDNDPVMEAIEYSKITPNSVLEIGCSNGWRVKAMQKKWGCMAYGIDPMFKTIFSAWNCRRGTADNVPHTSNTFDLVIYGWCLYLCDREDLFKIVSEGDRITKEGGYILIHDFHAAKSHKRKYKHKDELFSFKMDHSALWLANPTYKLITRQMFGSGDDQTSITIIRKDSDKGWPLHD